MIKVYDLSVVTDVFSWIIALCGVFSAFCWRVTVYLPFVWPWRASSGLSPSSLHAPDFLFCFLFPPFTRHLIVTFSSLFSKHIHSGCYCHQAFARLSAVYGGTYMLNKPECKVIVHSFSIRHPCIPSNPPPLNPLSYPLDPLHQALRILHSQGTKRMRWGFCHHYYKRLVLIFHLVNYWRLCCTCQNISTITLEKCTYWINMYFPFL